jgi:hypothetical protein
MELGAVRETFNGENGVRADIANRGDAGADRNSIY